jgi:hypothetical protein
MNKTKIVGYYQGKFKYLEGDKWPVHFYSDHPDEAKSKMFQEALTSALKEAIDFEDQDRIKTKVIVSNFGDADITRYENGESLNHLFEEGLYNIPEIEIKVVNRWIGHNEDSACTEPVARIKESSKSEEETEDELWTEAINETLKLDCRQSRIEWLKERFTITRKS